METGKINEMSSLAEQIITSIEKFNDRIKEHVENDKILLLLMPSTGTTTFLWKSGAELLFKTLFISGDTLTKKGVTIYEKRIFAHCPGFLQDGDDCYFDGAYLGKSEMP